MSGITNSVVTNALVIAALVTFSKVTGPPFGPGPGVDDLLIDDSGDHLIIEDATIDVRLLED